MKIDIIIISCSHGRALAEGASNMGYNVGSVSYSGSHWHQGHFNFTKSGFRPLKARSAVNAMQKLQADIGYEDIGKSKIPIISTIGYHLGRLVPPYGWYGHSTSERHFDEQDDLAVTSDVFLRDYVFEFRKKHFFTAKKMAAAGPFVVIPPPITFDRSNYDAFRVHISGRLIENGVTVFDPMAKLADPGHMLPDDLVADDGVHANGKYGEKVVKMLQDEKFL
jgi:hypothetical protein